MSHQAAHQHRGCHGKAGHDPRPMRRTLLPLKRTEADRHRSIRCVHALTRHAQCDTGGQAESHGKDAQRASARIEILPLELRRLQPCLAQQVSPLVQTFVRVRAFGERCKSESEKPDLLQCGFWAGWRPDMPRSCPQWPRQGISGQKRSPASSGQLRLKFNRLNLQVIC